MEYRYDWVLRELGICAADIQLDQDRLDGRRTLCTKSVQYLGFVLLPNPICVCLSVVDLLLTIAHLRGVNDLYGVTSRPSRPVVTSVSQRDIEGKKVTEASL